MEKVKPKILMKNNVLVKSRYDLSMIENRMFQLILYKAQLCKNTNTFICEVSYDEFKEVIKKRNSSTIKAIGTILKKRLRENSIDVMTNDKWYSYGFINGFTYDAKTHIFQIKMDADIYKLLFDYLKGYTPVNMSIFFSFKSYYAQRFYEILRLWSNSKTIINYSIEELREFLMLEEKHKAYCDFKKRVIAPAIKELNEKSMMQIDIEEHKVNRKVESIDFIVTDNDKRKYFEKDKDVLEHQQDQEQKQRKNYKKSNDLKFNNFEQREYDYKELEYGLLGWKQD